MPRSRRLEHQLIRMRRPAQERKIRRDVELRILKRRRRESLLRRLGREAKFVLRRFGHRLKMSMQKPAIRFLHAKNPEALSFLIFHVEIIPRAIVTAPPFAADPLRADGVAKLVNFVFMAE